jgi:Fe-S-cluster-containing dehydrogenase component
MHCLQPACASACLTKALLKTEEGPVIWRADKCMGCRYCMLSCPFDMPKFEYDSPTPEIKKCTLCAERIAQGGIPACAESCPSEAILFGRRSELLTEARRRIAEAPDDYVNHVYGEHEAGGTSVLYLSAVPFEDLGLPGDLERDPYPELTREFLYGVPVVLTLAPALLLGLSQATRRADTHAVEGDSHE